MPSDWIIKSLEDICSWVGVGIATSTTHAYSASGVPILRNQNILPNSIRDSDMLHIKEEFSDENASKKLRTGDLISIRTGYPGVTAVVPAKYDGCHSFTTLISRPNSKKINSFYLSFLINSDYGRKFVLGGQAGGAQQNLNVSVLKQFPVIIPPLPEQQKIAAILTSVDEVIEKTQAQINKLKDLKTGMMQELLTRGVGVDGKPHTEFKDSPVGRIPKGWDCVRLEFLLKSSKNSMRSGPFGSALLKHELVPSGHPYLGIDNVHIERFENKFKRFVSDEKFEQLQRYAVQEDDVMITIMGTVGRSCVVPKGVGKALSSKHVWTMSFDQQKYIPALICWQLNYSDWIKLQFKNESQGGVMESISSKTLKELWLPLPPISEQNKINKVHKSLSESIRVKEGLLYKHKQLKNALMQDLLTGKVRVKVDS